MGPYSNKKLFLKATKSYKMNFNIDSFEGTSQLTRSRSCFHCWSPLRSFSHRHTHGSKTSLSLATCRTASEGNVGTICSNLWITFASLHSPRRCRTKRMVPYHIRLITTCVCLYSLTLNMYTCVVALLRERWEMLLVKLRQTQQQIRACETAMVFAFVEVWSTSGHYCNLSDKGHFKYYTKTMIIMVFVYTFLSLVFSNLGDISSGSEEGSLDPA